MEQKRINIEIDPTRTKWLTNRKTIVIAREDEPTKESYLRSLVFEMSNAYHTEEFNEHNKKMHTIKKSKNDGRKQIRFGLNPEQMAKAMEETEWKSANMATKIGIEGVNNHKWDSGMVKYYSANKAEHMQIQKKGGHWKRYVTETKKVIHTLNSLCMRTPVVSVLTFVCGSILLMGLWTSLRGSERPTWSSSLRRRHLPRGPSRTPTRRAAAIRSTSRALARLTLAAPSRAP